MAVLVVGTSPLFAIPGYAGRKATTLWRGRLIAWPASALAAAVRVRSTVSILT
jgi:uncharacterized protein